MRNLLNFLAKYNNLIVFLILEGIAFSLLATGNSYHNSRLIKGFRGLTYGVERRGSDIRRYLQLNETNRALASENTSLKNSIERLIRQRITESGEIADTIYQQQYNYLMAEVVNNSVNKQKNFITLDKGRRQGVKTDMGVVAEHGIVGIIVGVSENFSVAMSLLNLDFKTSARLRSNGYFGSLNWDGSYYRQVLLNEIPQHVIVQPGDTIETTGFSSIFPEGVMIGTVSEVEQTGSDFHNVKVLLQEDFKKLRFVSIVGNLNKTERVQLEEQYQ